MSALPPKADMCSATRDVRFVPIADVKRYQSKTVPLRHLTRAHFILSSVAHGLQLEKISGRSFVAVKWPRLRHGYSQIVAWSAAALTSPATAREL